MTAPTGYLALESSESWLIIQRYGLRSAVLHVCRRCGRARLPALGRWRVRWHAAIAVSSELLARQILVGRLDLAVIHAIHLRLEVRPICGQPRRGGLTRVMHADMEAEVGSRRLAATPRSGTCCATSVVRRLCSTGREQQIIATQSQGFDPRARISRIPARPSGLWNQRPPHRWNPSPRRQSLCPNA